MATEASLHDPGTTQSKFPIIPLLVGCVIAAIAAAAACGGIVMFLAKSGKLGAGAPPPQKIEAVTTHPMVLEPMLVNLADDDGHAFLRAAVVLSIAEDDKKKAAAESKPVPGENAAVRDTILEILGKQHAATLLEPDGKERLKQELKQALTTQVPEARVQAVYFTDFLVQR